MRNLLLEKELIPVNKIVDYVYRVTQIGVVGRVTLLTGFILILILNKILSRLISSWR